jgi:ribosomal protein S18 acetylase RimI-like enzyme
VSAAIAIEEVPVDDEALIVAVERASLWAWPPERTAGVGGWLLRQGGTATRRQNSVQALAFTGELAVDRAIAEVEAFYARHGRVACFQITGHSQPADLDRLLAERGYRLEAPSEVRLRPLAEVPPEPGNVTLEGRPTAFAMQAVSDPHWSAAERAAKARLFARIRRPLVFAVRTEGGVPVAGGLAVVDRRLAGIYAMRTAVTARRRGHGRAILDRLLGWARAMGADLAYLQVEEANCPAQALYRSAGFDRRLYGYHYRVAGDR